MLPPADRFGGAYSLGVHDEDGSGPIPPALYMGDILLSIGGVSTNELARLDGWGWSSMGVGLNGPPLSRLVREFHSSDLAILGTTPTVVVGGQFSWSGQRRISRNIAAWHSQSWQSVNGGLGAGALAFRVFDEDGAGPVPPALFIGSGHNDPRTLGVGRWDGVRFTPVGTGLRPFIPTQTANAYALEVFDEDGPGPGRPMLFAAGSFTYADNAVTDNIARWDGIEWTTVGRPGTTGTRGVVWDMDVLDEDGPGPRPEALFVGGAFSGVGTRNNWWLQSRGVARWDGQEWSAVPGIESGGVYALAVHDDDGPGPHPRSLFATGIGLSLNGQLANAIIRWDGQEWHTLGGGLTGLGSSTWGQALAVYDEDGEGPNPGGLYIAGDFYHAGGLDSPGLARWGCPLPRPCYADCDRSTGVGSLDAFDFLCFLNRFEIRDPTACDCDASTGFRVCDLFDFLCFQNHFASGCP